MSYLGSPRIHLFGKFFADPSTTNNDLANYALKPPLDLSWNPNGSAFFRFLDCRIGSAVRGDGKVLDPGAGDPIARATVSAPQSPPTKVAKIVDLDPDQQSITQLFGVAVTVAMPGDKAGSPERWPSPSCATFGSSKLRSRFYRRRRRGQRHLGIGPDRSRMVGARSLGAAQGSPRRQPRASLDQIQLRRL